VPAGGEWAASCPDCFTPKERAPDTDWIGGWVDPSVGLDDMEKRKFLTHLGLELQPLTRYTDYARTFVEYLLKNSLLEYVKGDGRIILKWISAKQIVRI
jgi:hypothetical protein